MIGRMRSTDIALVTVTAILASGSSAPITSLPDVAVVRLPDGAVQPELAVDDRGGVHMVYLTGDARAADVYYARSTDGGRTFARAVRVNSQDGSAIAAGTVRGAQLALGTGGRVHVVWNGSDRAEPKPPVNPSTGRPGSPLLYSRSRGAAAFEAQRNLITQTTNLDGGGAIAASGNTVAVGWHAHPASGEGGEEARRVWLAQSQDEGAAFSRERAISDPSTGVCGCCGLRMLASAGDLHALYRSATNGTGRDTYALRSRDGGRTFQSQRVHPWEIGACPMTTMAIAGRERLFQAWETDGQVYFTALDRPERPTAPVMTVVNDDARRKHPRLAVNRDGSILLVWTEGTAWARGGSIAWQVFDPAGSPTSVRGSRPGLPVWGFAAAVARPDGGFTIIY